MRTGKQGQALHTQDDQILGKSPALGGPHPHGFAKVNACLHTNIYQRIHLDASSHSRMDPQTYILARTQECDETPSFLFPSAPDPDCHPLVLSCLEVAFAAWGRFCRASEAKVGLLSMAF